jgi:hypothetical protein
MILKHQIKDCIIRITFLIMKYFYLNSKHKVNLKDNIIDMLKVKVPKACNYN